MNDAFTLWILMTILTYLFCGTNAMKFIRLIRAQSRFYSGTVVVLPKALVEMRTKIVIRNS